jgi:regulatory protein
MAGTVTALKAQRSKDRVNVYLDGEFAFGLALIHALWLKIGQKLSDEDIAQLKAADTLEKAQQKAVNFIAYRPRTAREVRQRLKMAGADEETMDSVLGRLKSAGLLDDEAFGKAWVESRLRSNPRSRRMLAWELRQKGVGEKEVEAALEGVDDEEAAYRAAQKRWPKVQSLEPRERKRKLMEFLSRNGFNFQTIESVIARIESSDDGNEFQALDD